MYIGLKCNSNIVFHTNVQPFLKKLTTFFYSKYIDYLTRVLYNSYIINFTIYSYIYIINSDFVKYFFIIITYVGTLYLAITATTIINI